MVGAGDGGAAANEAAGGAVGGALQSSHADWLASREPEGPPALIACVRDLLDSHPEWDRLARVDAFIEAAELLLHRVLVGGPVARANAVYLLAADACITWAFEAAADDPVTIAGRAELATKRIAAIAAEFA